MNGITFDENYFPREIGFWYDIREDLDGMKSNFDSAAAIPELSPKLSDALDMLIPALNQAKRDISHNMGLGSDTADAFASTLTEVALNYGMTEDEAEQLGNQAGKE